MDGILNLWKPPGTHFTRCGGCRPPPDRAATVVGHAGTLDPMAEGVLVVGVGQDHTPSSITWWGGTKEYCARIHLGVTTDTDDTEGAVVAATEVSAFVVLPLTEYCSRSLASGSRSRPPAPP